LDNLISCNKLDKSFRQKVKETLLCKHRHHRSAGFRSNLSSIMSSRKSFNSSSNKLGSKNGTAVNLNDNNAHTTSDNCAVETNDTNQTPNIKLFRNYSQPAFPNTLKPQPSIERSESVPQNGHLTYPSPPSHVVEDENVENKVYKSFISRKI